MAASVGFTPAATLVIRWPPLFKPFSVILTSDGPDPMDILFNPFRSLPRVISVSPLALGLTERLPELSVVTLATLVSEPPVPASPLGPLGPTGPVSPFAPAAPVSPFSPLIALA